MIRLTLFLCAGLFLLMLIGGQDRGQLRPGLARAAAERAAEPVTAPVAVADAEEEPAPVLVTAAPVAAPDPEPAPVVTAAAEPAAPEVDAAATAVIGDVPVFTLSTFADGAAVISPAAGASAPDPGGDVQVFYISGRSVNVREGPGTENPVLARLTRGEAVGVVWTDDTGWARVRIEGDGIEGYVSTDFLSPTAP